ncbi:MAG: helix-turn-helix domain-containing protein [Microbacteriaceae bacterium]
MAESTVPVQRAMETIGGHVTMMRKINRLTAKRTAARAGVSLTTLRKFERGENVEFTTALEILRAVGLLDQLVDGADPLQSQQGRARLAAFIDGHHR